MGSTGARLRARDLVFLSEESPESPLHNATVEIFAPGDSGFGHDRLVELIGERISFVPRYRQRLRTVPGRLAAPVWVDDEHFDLRYHVRRSALPSPGTEAQLLELVGRIVSRPLDRSRPLWEVYVVEGLSGGRIALLYKTHQVLVDGVETVDLGQVLLDNAPEPKQLGGDEWSPRRTPSPTRLLVGAVQDTLATPEALVDTVRVTSGAVRRGAEEGARRGLAVANALAGRRPQRESPFSGRLSQQRLVASVDARLADFRKVREVHGGTVNDVILATVSGGLRGWLMTRAESLGGVRQVRAVVPVSVIDSELEATSLGSQIAAHHVELPIGEASPVVRLHQVSYSFQAHQDTGRAVAANRLAGIAGFAPTTFHAIGARVATRELRRGYQLSVTNVPGPQSPLYAAGAQMVATYPVPPLLPDHPLAIGVTSYDGTVFFGITADRVLVPDVEVLASCLREALDELLDTVSRTRSRVPRGRQRSRPRD